MNIANVKDTPRKGSITFAAYHPKTQLPVTCRPMQDKSGKLKTGQGKSGYYESLTAEERAALGQMVFDYDTSYTISDGKVLNLEDELEYQIWVGWLHYNPYVAIDKNAGEQRKDAAFYIVNVENEAKAYVDKTAKIDEARPAIRKLSLDEMIVTAITLGHPSPKGVSPTQLMEWLLKKADDTPQSVLDAINPANKARVHATNFFREAVKWKIIERMKDGLFYYGGDNGISVGHIEEKVVEWLLDPANIERRKAMKNQLAEITKQGITAAPPLTPVSVTDPKEVLV